MADIDKIVREAEIRHNCNEQCNESNLQLKDSIFDILLLLFFLSPLIILIIMKIASI